MYRRHRDCSTVSPVAVVVVVAVPVVAGNRSDMVAAVKNALFLRKTITNTPHKPVVGESAPPVALSAVRTVVA